MAERYSFFNAEVDTSGNYDRTYLAEDIAMSLCGNRLFGWFFCQVYRGIPCLLVISEVQFQQHQESLFGKD